MGQDIENTIKQILEIAVNAPSGDNSQPWQFHIGGSSCDVFLVAKIDPTTYNFNEFGSYLAHGALIENILLTAKKFKLQVSISTLPDLQNKLHTATIHFSDGNDSTDLQLADVVPLRHTNRKPYKINSVTKREINNIEADAQKIQGPSIVFKNTPESNSYFLHALSVNDEIMFSNRQVHSALFNIINWSEEEDAKRVRGLYVKTIELNNEQIIAFRQLQNWNMMNTLSRLGIPRLIAATNRKLYAATAFYGAITIPKVEEKEFITVGRMVERVWLSAISKGISLHPVAGLSYLSMYLKNTNGKGFTEKEKKKVLDADVDIRKFFNLGDETVAFLFRLGRGLPATAKSRKLSPVYI